MSTVTDTSLYAQLGLSGGTQSSSSQGALGQEDFLELMITQLRNQDPFQPMESGEFLGQLASFGTVDGIRELQESLSQMSSALTSNQALQAASLLDREVLFATDRMAFDGEHAVSGAVELPSSATEVSVGVYDASGQLLRRIDLGTQPGGLVEFSWDGRDESGRPVAAGTYELRAEARSGSLAEAVQVLGRATVENVTLGSAGEPLTIGIRGLGDVDFARVRQIG